MIARMILLAHGDMSYFIVGIVLIVFIVIIVLDAQTAHIV
jgi:hypothetical protein